MSILSAFLKLISSPPRAPFDDFFDHAPLRAHPDFRTRVALDAVVSNDPNEVRSWLGGRPELPEGVDWPWIEGRAAVFVAQIACADLPRDLWGGIGPRDGWLVVFLGARFEGLRVLHVPARGAPRYEAEGVTEVHFTFSRDRRNPQDGPLFPRLPVCPRVIAQEAPEVHPPAPIRPRTIGQLRTCVDFLLDRIKPPDPEKVMVGFADRARVATAEDAGLIHAAAARSLPHVREVAEHNAALTSRLESLVDPYAGSPPEARLPDGAWKSLVDVLASETVAKVKWSAVRDGVRAEYESLPVLCTPLFRHVTTVGELRAQLDARASWFGTGDFFKPERNLRSMRRYAKTPPRDRPDSQDFWKARVVQADLEEEWMAEDRKKRQPATEAEQALRASIVDREDHDPADRALQDRLIAADRANPALIKWDRTIKAEIPKIAEAAATFEPIGGPFTIEGIAPDGGSSNLWEEIVRNQLERLDSGGLDETEVSDLQQCFPREAGEGNVMGGLSPGGWEDLGLMGLASYLSEKGRREIVEGGYLTRHLDDEPDVLLLHLKTDAKLNWMWGDMYTLAIFVPRTDFARGVFDRAHLRITNG